MYISRVLNDEKALARMNMYPALQAEEDVRFLKVQAVKEAEDDAIMKNVEGWEEGKQLFSSGRWLPPTKR